MVATRCTAFATINSIVCNQEEGADLSTPLEPTLSMIDTRDRVAEMKSLKHEIIYHCFFTNLPHLP